MSPTTTTHRLRLIDILEITRRVLSVTTICFTSRDGSYIKKTEDLIKGASGQAIQNMNLLFKFPDYLGLK